MMTPQMRRKNVVWDLSVENPTQYTAIVAVLMDIRDELQELKSGIDDINKTFYGEEYRYLPHTLKDTNKILRSRKSKNRKRT